MEIKCSVQGCLATNLEIKTQGVAGSQQAPLQRWGSKDMPERPPRMLGGHSQDPTMGQARAGFRLLCTPERNAEMRLSGEMGLESEVAAR